MHELVGFREAILANSAYEEMFLYVVDFSLGQTTKTVHFQGVFRKMRQISFAHHSFCNLAAESTAIASLQPT
jgi:hypothetical protein